MKRNVLPTAYRRRGNGSVTGNRMVGSTLVEVLVALLIISLGLLGIGGLAASTFSFNKTAQLRLTGTALVNDFADRARLNVFGYDLGGYNVAYGDAVPAMLPFNIDEADDATAAALVASNDRSDFMQTVAGRLPQGQVVVATAPAANRSMDIWLVWQEPEADAGPALSLFEAGQRNCPEDLPAAVTSLASCMYFKINL